MGLVLSRLSEGSLIARRGCSGGSPDVLRSSPVQFSGALHSSPELPTLLRSSPQFSRALRTSPELSTVLRSSPQFSGAL
eukprot:12450529-Alexandrium_andersonii.AAC.1